MTRTFTEELERRMRAVLSARVRAPLPADIPVAIEPLVDYDPSTDDVLGLRLSATAPPYPAFIYEGHDAWAALLADLQAIPDAPFVIATNNARTRMDALMAQMDVEDLDKTPQRTNNALARSNALLAQMEIEDIDRAARHGDR